MMQPCGVSVGLHGPAADGRTDRKTDGVHPYIRRERKEKRDREREKKHKKIDETTKREGRTRERG